MACSATASGEYAGTRTTFSPSSFAASRSTLLKPAFGLSLEDARRAVRALEGAPLIELDLALTLRALDVCERYQVSFWDGLIIAAAERARCSEILTEDLNHGQDYFGVVARNPFLNAVSEP